MEFEILILVRIRVVGSLCTEEVYARGDGLSGHKTRKTREKTKNGRTRTPLFRALPTCTAELLCYGEQDSVRDRNFACSSAFCDAFRLGGLQPDTGISNRKQVT